MGKGGQRKAGNVGERRAAPDAVEEEGPWPGRTSLVNLKDRPNDIEGFIDKGGEGKR